MPETPQQQYARIRAHADEDGRLPLPEQAMWEIFPFEPESLRVKPLDDLALPEPPRGGDGDKPCWRCAHPDADVAWSNDRWLLDGPGDPLGLPFAAVLMPREHLDLADLDDATAAEMGVIAARVARAVEALPQIGRVHVNKFGDGGAHLHVFLVGRPAGMSQLRGSCLLLWEEMLPRTPADLARETLRVAAEALADLGTVRAG